MEANMTCFAHNHTNHAILRSQQRGVPPMIIDWLHDFGERRYDGHGGVIRFFSAKSRYRLEQEVGRDQIRRLSEHLRCYLVESSHDGSIITVAKRYSNSRYPHH
jgi:hypothetical protein